MMEPADRIVSLEEAHLSRFSGHDVDDLMEYLDPSVLLVTGEVSPRRRRWLEQRVPGPVLALDRSDSQVHDERRYMVLVSLDDDLPNAGDASLPKAPCVVDSTVEETLDPHTMEATWSGLEAYRRFAARLPGRTHHLSANLPAGRSLPPGDDRESLLYGSQPVEDRFDRAIPSLRLDDREGVYLEETVRSSHVGLRAIPGVGWEKERALNRAGIERREQVMGLDPATLMDLPGIGPYYACVLLAGARALAEERPVWFASDPLADEPIAYLDIETDAATSVSNVWQIGVFDEVTGEYRYFLQTRDPDDARTVPRRFARWVHEEAADRTFVAWYGKGFDFPWLDEFVGRHAEPDHRSTWLETRRVDLLEDVVRPRARLPARSQNLDVVARRLGYERCREGLDGADAARAYARWCAGETPDWERWIDYCRDDVMAMKHLRDRLRAAPAPLDRFSLRERDRRSRGTPT